MLNFKKLTPDLIPKLRPFFEYARNRACDNTAGAAFMWRDYFHTEYDILDDVLHCKARAEDGRTVFSFPMGKDWRAGLSALDAYCKAEGITPAIWASTQSEIPILKEFFGDIIAEPENNWSDYLHLAEDFRTFSGRRFNGQRNHMNFFKRTYPDYVFEEIGESNLQEVRDFFGGIAVDKQSAVFKEEMLKTAEVLDHYALYGMFGCVLKVGGKVIGFSAGERVRDTLYAHIEKADTSYRGAYQMLANQFVLRFGDGAVYLNREEDAGDAGLRTSKLAYHPYEILEKFTVIAKRV